MNEQRLVSYDFGDDGLLLLDPRCPKCGRYCKTDDKMSIAKAQNEKIPNATCKKHGRVHVTNCGFI
jgi:hypothetical protein